MATNPVTSGLVVQLDSRSYVGSDNDLVSAWTDDSGNGNDASSSGTNRPTYKTGIINGNPVMRFAVDGMTGAVTGGNWASAQGMQILALVANFTASPSFGGLGSLAVSGFDNGSGCMSLGGTTGVANSFGLNTQGASRITWRVTSEPGLTIYSGGFNATHWRWAAGTQINESALASTVGTGTNEYCVGCRLFSGINSGVTADYCMYLIYDRCLSPSEHKQVAEWALTEFGGGFGGSTGTAGFTGIEGISRSLGT